MILYPAIDLKSGKCVRLMQGDMDRATVYNSNPASQAKMFEELGFEWLHVVDLDGAVRGESCNSDAIEAILATVHIPVQVGGGIRDRVGAEKWLRAGVHRLVLGSAAVKRPELVDELAGLYPGRIAVGIDARNGKVAVEGWTENFAITPIELAKRFETSGAAAIIYTDIARDGTGSGLNLDETFRLADRTSIPVIASGGLGSLHDLIHLRQRRHSNVTGVICGRALYDGRLDAREALRVFGEPAC